MQGAETPDIDEQNQVENFVVAVFLFLDFPNTFLQVLMMLLKVSCEVRKTTTANVYDIDDESGDRDNDDYHVKYDDNCSALPGAPREPQAQQWGRHHSWWSSDARHGYSICPPGLILKKML